MAKRHHRLRHDRTSPVVPEQLDDRLKRSDGRRIHRVEVKAIDVDGATVAAGAPGELCARLSVMKAIGATRPDREAIDR